MSCAVSRDGEPVSLVISVSASTIRMSPAFTEPTSIEYTTRFTSSPGSVVRSSLLLPVS